MQRKVVITGTGVISSLADSPEQLHATPCAGRSGLQPRSRFQSEPVHCMLDGEIQSFKPKHYLGDKNCRPLDRPGQLTASATQLTLENSGWTAEMRSNHEVGIVVGTMYASMRSICDFDKRSKVVGPGSISPMDFPNIVLNGSAGHSAIWHNLRGVNSTIMMGPTSGLQAIAYATDMIRNGREKAIVAGGVEELAYETYYGFDSANLLCR